MYKIESSQQEGKRSREQRGSSSSNSDRSQKKRKKRSQKNTEISQGMSSLALSSSSHNPTNPESSNIESDGKKRLLIGESSLSYALALAKKHPKAAKEMYATTYEKADGELFKKGSKGAKNKEELEKKGAKVIHGVDIRKSLPEEISKPNQYDHMYFNYPRTAKRAERNKSTKRLIEDYETHGFNQLKEGGKLHYSVPSSKTYRKNESQEDLEDLKKARNTRNKQYGSHPLTDAEKSEHYHFGFHKKLRDPQERYGEYGYSHEKTGKKEGLSKLQGHEYILKKRDTPVLYGKSKRLEYSDVPTDSGTDSEFESEDEKFEERSREESESENKEHESEDEESESEDEE